MADLACSSHEITARFVLAAVLCCGGAKRRFEKVAADLLAAGLRAADLLELLVAPLETAVVVGVAVVLAALILALKPCKEWLLPLA